MGTDGVYIDSVHTGAGGHEEAIAFPASEADIGADFRKVDLADAVSVGGEDVNTVITLANPASTGPDVAVGVTTNAVSISRFFKTIEFHGGEFLTLAEFGLVVDIPDFDVFALSSIRNVKLFVIVGETQAVGFVDLISQLRNIAGLCINAIDGFFVVQWAFVTFVVPHATVTWVSEPDGTIFRVYNDVVGSIEGFALPITGENCGGAVVFVANDSTVAMFAGDLASLKVKGVTVAVSGRMTEESGPAIVFNPAKLHIVGNVGEEKIASNTVPCRTFRPEGLGVVVNALD